MPPAREEMARFVVVAPREMLMSVVLASVRTVKMLEVALPVMVTSAGKT
jgi:hypothetical protein